MKIITVEEQLTKLRAGKDQDLKLKYGELEIPCRVMNATEESQVVVNAKRNLKVPNEHDRKSFEGIEVMKCLLEAGCKVQGTPYASRVFLDQLSTVELESLYDQYISTIRTANVQYEKLSQDKIVDMITAVKKKEILTSDLFTWQLVEIGRYFLEVILLMGSEHGS